MGIYAMAILDTTLVEWPPGTEDPQPIDPTSYVTAVKNLFKKGVWPNKCDGNSLQDKPTERGRVSTSHQPHRKTSSLLVSPG